MQLSGTQIVREPVVALPGLGPGAWTLAGTCSNPVELQGLSRLGRDLARRGLFFHASASALVSEIISQVSVRSFRLTFLAFLIRKYITLRALSRLGSLSSP